VSDGELRNGGEKYNASYRACYNVTHTTSHATSDFWRRFGSLFADTEYFPGFCAVVALPEVCAVQCSLYSPFPSRATRTFTEPDEGRTRDSATALCSRALVTCHAGYICL